MADNYRVNDVNDPLYQYRNIIGVPSRKRIICGILSILFILTLVVIAFTIMSKTCCAKAEKLQPFVAFQGALDTSVNPCDDFYEFICGPWEKNHPLPPYDARITAFSILQDVVNRERRSIFENTRPSNELPRGVNDAIQFYNHCVEQNNALTDLEILRKYFNEIGGWPILNRDTWNEDSFDWFQASAFLIKKLDLHTIIGVNSIDNDKNEGRNVIYLKPPSALQADQTLNDFTTMQMLYMILVSLNSSSLHSDVINDIENLNMTETKWKNELAYSKETERLCISVKELTQRIPEFDWLKYFQLIMNSTLHTINETITLNDTVVIENIEYLKKVVTVLNSNYFTKLELANLFGWYLVKDIWILIPRVLQNYASAFNFTSDDVKTAASNQCYDIVRETFAYSLDYLYVKNSSHLGIQDSVILTRYLKSAYRDILEESSWINETAKESALLRLNSMQDIIGFQGFLNNKTEFNKLYENFPTFSQNILKYFFKIQHYYAQRRILHLKIPAHLHNWILPRSVSDVSAYYVVHKNTLVYPLSLHNPPFYYLYGPWHLNFGAIGSVIAHEIMHGFDNFTKLKIDTSMYKKRSQCFKDQYDIYDIDGIYKNNGTRTLRENIADSEGLRASYRAYKKHEREIGHKQKYLPFNNFTPDQMFFISYGNVWCSQISPQIRERLITDTHSLPEIRVNKAVSNSESFALAFNCPKDSPMNPVKKCSIW